METYKIYIFGIVALALALATLSFHLLSDHKKKKVSEVKFLTRIYIFVFFFMIVLMLLIMIEFYKGPQVMLTNSDDYRVVLKEIPDRFQVEDVKSGKDRIYVDPAHHFFIGQPNSAEWKAPNILNGLRSYLEKAGLETGKANIESFLKWNPYKDILSCILNDITVKPYEDMMVCLNTSLLKSTFGQMLQMSSSTVWEYGDAINVRVDPEFRTTLTDILRSVQKQAADSAGRTATEGDSSASKGYVDLAFVNYINVTVLDKSSMPVDNEKISLANYFLKNTINLTSTAEKLIANENMMLFTSSFDFENALIGTETGNLRVHRWVRMIEEPTKLFIIEMAYCPRTDLSGIIWNDEKLMFESFGILSE